MDLEHHKEALGHWSDDDEEEEEEEDAEEEEISQAALGDF